jgi:outer membrane autotransporter protein
MKAIAIAAAAASLLLGGVAAHAQQAPAASPVYGELGYSWAQIQGNGFKATPGAVRGIVGYNLHPNLAVEGMLEGGTGHETDNGVSAKLKSSYGLFVKPKYDIGNAELFARVGWARTNLDLSTGDVSSNSFAYGLGAKYNLTPRMNVGLDYTRLADKNGVKVDGVTLGVGYNF